MGTVKPGFGRNFLLPRNVAVRATKSNIAAIEAKREALEAQNQEAKAAAEKRAEGMQDLKVRIVRQASEDGKLYGSVAVRDVVAALQGIDHEVDRSLINLNGAIKTVGEYSATITLHADVKVPVTLEVVRSVESGMRDSAA